MCFWCALCGTCVLEEAFGEEHAMPMAHVPPPVPTVLCAAVSRHPNALYPLPGCPMPLIVGPIQKRVPPLTYNGPFTVLRTLTPLIACSQLGERGWG